MGTEERGRCGEVAVMGRWGVIWQFFWGGVQHVYWAKFMLIVSHSGNPITSKSYIEIKYTKNLKNVLNQNVNVTKRARFVTFAIHVSVVDNLWLLQHYKWNTIKIRLLRLVIHAPYGSNLMTNLDVFISRWKNWPLSRGYFGSWGHALVARGLNKSQCMDCPPGQKKVAVVERWPLGKVPQYKRWLYILLGMLANELSVTGRFANVMAPIVRTLDSAVYAPDKSQSGR